MALYKEVYNMNTDDSSGLGAKRPHADKAYQMVLCSFERLTFAAVAQALAAQPDSSLLEGITDQYVRRITSNILEADPTNGKLSFTHPCAREYLETSGDFSPKFGTVECHATLGEACLAVLMVPSIYKAVAPRATYGSPRFSSQERMYHYAVDNWHSHCEFGNLGTKHENVEESLLWRFLDSASRISGAAFDSTPFGAWLLCTEHREEPEDSWNRQCWSVFNPAFVAASFGLLGVLKNLDDQDRLDVFERDYLDRTLLHVAAHCGQSAIVDYLVKRFVHCDDQANACTDRTPLLLACANNHLEVVQLLLRPLHSADPSLVDRSKRTCFHLAIEYDPDTRVLEELLEYSDVGETFRTSSSSPSSSSWKDQCESVIEWAIRLGAIKSLKLIMRQLTRPPYWPTHGNMPLAAAHLGTCLRSTISKRDFAITRLLVESGAPVTFPEGGNLLHTLAACISSREEWRISLDEIVGFLVKYGANPEQVDEKGYIPFERASVNPAVTQQHLVLFDPGIATWSRRELLERMLTRAQTIQLFALRTPGIRFLVESDPLVLEREDGRRLFPDVVVELVQKNLSPMLVRDANTKLSNREYSRTDFLCVKEIVLYFNEVLGPETESLQSLLDLVQRIELEQEG
jgi:ankyrin repeat protein